VDIKKSIDVVKKAVEVVKTDKPAVVVSRRPCTFTASTWTNAPVVAFATTFLGVAPSQSGRMKKRM
jgi:TPP-dependent indolepyruvate ferredoxin oxidoreductase alpha subunit